MPRKTNRPRKPVSRFTRPAVRGRSANPKGLLPVYTIYLSQSRHIPWGSHSFAHLAAARREAARIGSQWIGELKESGDKTAGYIVPAAHFSAMDLEVVLRAHGRHSENPGRTGNPGAHQRMLELEGKVRGQGQDLTPPEAHELRLTYDALRVPPLHRMETSGGRDRRMIEWEVGRSRGVNPLPEDHRYRNGRLIVRINEKLEEVGMDEGRLVEVNAASGNEKTGPVVATSVCQLSCPDDCPFFTPLNDRTVKGHGHEGCYGEVGHQAIQVTSKVNNGGMAAGADPVDIAKAEAHGIQVVREKILKGKTKPMRLHVVGDAKTDAAARVLADVCRDWKDVWAYTHAWRHVSRSSWGTISILASCETPDEVAEATRRGYACATVIPIGFGSNKKPYEWNGMQIYPCKAQTKASGNCMACKLCWNDKKTLIPKGWVIAFTTHGETAGVAKEHVLAKLKADGWDPNGGGKVA